MKRLLMWMLVLAACAEGAVDDDDLAGGKADDESHDEYLVAVYAEDLDDEDSKWGAIQSAIRTSVAPLDAYDSPWTHAGSWFTKGTLFGGRPRNAIVDARDVADVEAKLHADLKSFTGIVFGYDFEVHTIRLADYRAGMACNESSWTYMIRFAQPNTVSPDQLDSCLRGLVGSEEYSTDTGYRWIVSNPFTVAGWCASADDMAAEKARIARDCPAVASVVLEIKDVNTRRLAMYLGYAEN